MYRLALRDLETVCFCIKMQGKCLVYRDFREKFMVNAPISIQKYTSFSAEGRRIPYTAARFRGQVRLQGLDALSGELRNHYVTILPPSPKDKRQKIKENKRPRFAPGPFVF
jgi:hypothetical protein